MAHFPAYYSLILIFIFTCHAILVTEGRSLKSFQEQDEIHHHNDEKVKETKIIDGFRPTMPGKSPGAGNSFTEHGIDAQSEVMVNVSHIDPSSTIHGHSPGAGHSIHN